MRKIVLVIASVLLFAAPAFAQVTMWIDVNQGTPTLHWTPVTETVNNEPIPAEDTITYESFLANAITDPDKTNPSLITPTPIAATELAIDLGGVEGKYLCGVRAVRTVPDGRIARSDISWSDNPEVVSGDPFGLTLLNAPKAPTISITGE